jgi:uncharacterized protein (UPF0276 family)
LKEWGNTECYLQALPLHNVREIHFTRPGRQDTQMVDFDGPMEGDDFVWLAWVLERTPTEAITQEVEDMPAEFLLRQIAIMRYIIEGIT